MTDTTAETIRGWAMRCRALAGAVNDSSMAQRTADIMKEQVVESVAQQRSVDGTAWEPRRTVAANGRPIHKAVPGAPVLVNAAAAVEAEGRGNVAIITLSGPEVFHHYGAGRAPRRPILPSGGIGKLGLAISKGIVSMCEEFMTRAGRHDKGGGGKWKGGRK